MRSCGIRAVCRTRLRPLARSGFRVAPPQTLNSSPTRATGLARTPRRAAPSGLRTSNPPTPCAGQLTEPGRTFDKLASSSFGAGTAPPGTTTPGTTTPPVTTKDVINTALASYTLPDKGVPSSSLTVKTGIPGSTPVDEVKMVVLFPDVNWINASATRHVDLLWGVIVPTTSIDGSSSATGGDATILAYANTLAHEVGHVLGLGHRGDLANGVSDGLTTPARKNLMHPTEPPPQAENIDIIQVKAMRFSEVVFRNP